MQKSFTILLSTPDRLDEHRVIEQIAVNNRFHESIIEILINKIQRDYLLQQVYPKIINKKYIIATYHAKQPPVRNI